MYNPKGGMMKLSSMIHRFFISIVLAAPFYNLMKKSDHKIYIITGVLIFLNITINLIGNRARKSLLLKPVTLAEKRELFRKFRKQGETGNYAADGRTEEKRLKDLKSLYEKNLITLSEYESKKKEIIDGI